MFTCLLLRIGILNSLIQFDRKIYIVLLKFMESESFAEKSCEHVGVSPSEYIRMLSCWTYLLYLMVFVRV